MFLAFQYPQQVPGRVGHQLPAPGAVGPQGHRPVGARAAPVDHGVDGAPRHGPVLRRPLPQRGLLRRREEAQRDPADGHPRTRDGRSSTRPTPASTSTPSRSSPKGVQEVRARPARRSASLAITHYQRLLDHLEPDVVHILIDGRIVDSRRAGAGRAARARGLRGVAMTDALDVAADQEGLPAPRPRGPRPAARLPRLGHHLAEAPGRARRHAAATTRQSNANVHRGTYLIAEEATAALEGARAKVARFIGAGARPRGRLHQERHRGPQPRGQGVGPRQPPGRRRRRAHRAGAPRQHRPVAPARTTSWASSSAGSRSAADGHLDLTDLDRLVDGAKVVSLHRHVQRARHPAPGASAWSPPPTPPAPSPSSTPASTSPTWPPTCRPGAPTSSPSPATRCAAPPASACSGARRSSSRPRPRSSAAAR